MPYSGQLRNEFVALGAEGFLSTYVVKAQAGGGSRTAHAQDLYTTAAQPGLNPAENRRVTAITGGLGSAAGNQIQINAAPQVFAYFTPAVLPTFRHPVFKPAVTVWFDSAQNIGGVNGLPCFLVPSAADRAVGIQIPAHAPGDPVYVFTTTQDGCSFRISGTFAQPYLSHTNAYSAAPAARPATLLARLNLLQTAFINGGPPVPVNQNLAEFALFPTDGSESQRDQSRRLLQYRHQNRQKHRKSLTIGHKNYFWSVHQDTINAINGAWKPSTSLIIGEYDAANQVWNFAYQECGDVKISEFSERKVGTIKLKQTPVRDMTCGAIYVSGHFWPGIPTETPFPI
ncbi:MAG: hypothetical protein JOY54_11200 [Acidobacteriaceae bacterium]|nr:hypothetical protein [Acidobacteriaceae bacterium]